MVDVTAKDETAREAVAEGRIFMQPETLALILNRKVVKGDVFGVARIAGIMAAKRTPDLVPLCHPIALSGVEVEVRARATGLEVTATVRTVDRTGVEMEALAAVAAGCLTIYDMLKRHERGMRIAGIALLEKKGGRSGHWKRPAAAPRG